MPLYIPFLLKNSLFRVVVQSFNPLSETYTFLKGGHCIAKHKTAIPYIKQRKEEKQ